MQTTMTVKGQVTIPKIVRERAGIRPGDLVEVGNGDRGDVVLRLVEPEEAVRARKSAEFSARLDALVGAAATGRTTDEFMAMIREPVPL